MRSSLETSSRYLRGSVGVNIPFWLVVKIWMRSLQDWTSYFLALSLGLLAFSLVEQSSLSIQTSVGSRARDSLGSSLLLQARRPLTELELSEFKKLSRSQYNRVAMTTEFYSMLQIGESNSRLVEVRTLQNGFPFYGTFRLRTKDKAGEREESLSGNEIEKLLEAPDRSKIPGTLVSQELTIAQNLTIGDRVFLGNEPYRIQGIILEQDLRGSRSLGLAPVLYVLHQHMPKIALEKEGTTRTYRVHLESFQTKSALQELGFSTIKELKQSKFPSSDTKLQSVEDFAEETLGAIGYLENFSRILALVSFFLSMFSARILLGRPARALTHIASLFKELGFKTRRLNQLFFASLLLFSSLALLVSASATRWIAPYFSARLTAWMKINPINGSPSEHTYFIALFQQMGPVILILCLIFAFDFYKLSNATTQRSMPLSPRPSFRRQTKRILNGVISLLSLFSLTALLTHSLRLSVGVFLGGIVIWIFYALIFDFYLRVLQKILNQSQRVLLPVRAFLRSKVYARLVFFTVFSTSVLLFTPYLIQRSILKEIDFNSPDSSLEKPSLFLFDIQKDQVQHLETKAKQKGIDLRHLTPLIQARLLTINGKPLSQHGDRKNPQTAFETVVSRFRQDENRETQQAQNRIYNLTYSKDLQSNETRIEGRPLRSRILETDPIEVSVEKRFAETLGIRLNDRLEFEILGMPFSTTVVEIRKVNWAAFQPSFFLKLFPEELLKLPPQSFLSAVYNLDLQEANQLQESLSKEFPNISILRVEETFQRAQRLLVTIEGAFELLGWICFSSGIMMMLLLLILEVRNSLKSISVLRVMGVSPEMIRRMVFQAFFMGAWAPLFLSLTATLSLCKLLAWLYFDVSLYVPWIQLGLSLVYASLILAGAAWITHRWMLRGSLELKENLMG